MPRVVCPCGREMTVSRIGVFALELTELYEPYKLWAADELSCNKCQRIVVANFGNGPIAEHWQDDFHEQLEKIHNTPEAVIHAFI